MCVYYICVYIYIICIYVAVFVCFVCVCVCVFVVVCLFVLSCFDYIIFSHIVQVKMSNRMVAVLCGNHWKYFTPVVFPHRQREIEFKTKEKT